MAPPSGAPRTNGGLVEACCCLRDERRSELLLDSTVVAAAFEQAGARHLRNHEKLIRCAMGPDLGKAFVTQSLVHSRKHDAMVSVRVAGSLESCFEFVI